MEKKRGIVMIEVLATNIISPIGYTIEENYRALQEGRSALSSYDDWQGVPERFAASLFSDEQNKELAVENCTRFESLVIRSVEDALSQTDIDAASPRTLFILSTTKANVEELGAVEAEDKGYLSPGCTASKIARHFGMTTSPVVVCNACISGVTAQLLACRLIEAMDYDHVIICCADCQSLFDVSIFLSFKSLSPEACKPFDIERRGLNLGEAASTIILGKSKEPWDNEGKWKLLGGYLNNDAYHLSAPSPDGSGMLAVISKTLEGWNKDDLALVGVHGTATMFNDQMESIAIERASLSSIPLSAIKGYYGHTFGAAGVLETILMMRGLDDGYVFPVKGFEEIGVSGKVTISSEARKTDKQSFIKIISGFGGCNGALLFSKNAVHERPAAIRKQKTKMLHSVHLTDSFLNVDGREIQVARHGKAMLTEIYKTLLEDYPRFYKMDVFNRLVYVASELLVKAEGADVNDENRAVILFNGASTLVQDRKHLATVSNMDEFFPSPSVAIYTLPNIVTGELAIKNHYKGETTLYILDGRNEHLMGEIVDATFAMSDVRSMITGWVDCTAEDTFEADIKILTL